MKFGLGPVFRFEWISTARNWRVYALRVLFGVSLLVILAMVAADNRSVMAGSAQTIQQQAEAGRIFSASIVTTELVLMLLIAPAATASTLCLDKARGTLAHVLTTDLTNYEIIFGKLVARILPSLGLVISSLGVIAICTLMGGIDPMGLAGSILVILGVTVLGATLSICLSVWAAKTHEVVMASYLILIVYLTFYPVWCMVSWMPLGLSRPPEWLELGNPFMLILNTNPGKVLLHRFVFFFLACLTISALLAGIATWRLRAVAIQQLNRPAGPKIKRRRWRKAAANAQTEPDNSRPRRSFLPSPSLDGNPVLWREWHRRKPSKWSRMIWRFYTLASIGFTTLGIYIMARPGLLNLDELALVLFNGMQVTIGLLLISVSAATSLAEERVQGSLDVLLSSSLSTRSIVWGKWFGAFRAIPFLAVLPCLMVAAAVVVNEQRTGWPILVGGPTLTWSQWSHWLAVPLTFGLILAYGAALTSVGLVMATWVSRLDRAVSLTVSVFVLMTLVWPIVVGMLLPEEESRSLGLACGSPFAGIGFTGSSIDRRMSGRYDLWPPQIAWATFWILAYASVAALLLKLELSRFNHKLGRTPEEGMPQHPTPALGANEMVREAVLVGV